MDEFTTQDENSRPEFDDGEQQAMIDAMAKLAPPEAHEGAVNDMADHFRESVAKLGRLTALSGNSHLRASIGLIEAPENTRALVGCLFFSLDGELLPMNGSSTEEFHSAMAASFAAIQEYFDSFNPQG